MFLSLIGLLWLAQFSSATSALHCWEFNHRLTSVPDQCGTASDFTLGPPMASSPNCDGSGCNFHNSAHFTTTLPNTFNAGWTFVVWGMFYNPTGTILQVKRGSSEIILYERTSIGIEALIDGQSIVNVLNFYWGDSRWMCVYVGSTDNKSYVGYIQNDGSWHTQFTVSGNKFDLQQGDIVYVGNNQAIDSPMKLLRRVEFYPAGYSWQSTPQLSALYKDIQCYDISSAPFCAQSHSYLKLSPSYIEGDIVVDSSNSGHPASIISQTTDAPTMSLEGLEFFGSQGIESIALDLQMHSLTISVWLMPDASFTGVVQEIFRNEGSLLTLNLLPSSGQVTINSSTSLSNPSSFSSGVWTHFGFSLLTESSTEQKLLYSINNSYNYALITLGLIDMNGFVLGASYYGKMREFNLYKSYLGSQSFDDPSRINHLCSSGKFYDEVSSQCGQCHANCLDCRDATNTQCGYCAHAAHLLQPGYPGVCIVCHSTCGTCLGQSNLECLTCAPNLIQTFVTGSSGQCAKDCSLIPFQDMDPFRVCPWPTIPIQVGILVAEGEVPIIIIIFSQPVLCSSLPSISVTLQIQETSIPIDFSSSMSCSGLFTSFTLELNPSSSFVGTETLSVAINNEGQLASADPDYSLPSPIETPAATAPRYEHVSSNTLDIVRIISLSLKGLYTVELIVAIVLQSLFQISAGIFWATINMDQLLIFAPFMLLKLPRSVFVYFRILSFAVGDIYVLELLYDYTIGLVLSEGQEQPWSQNFQKNGFYTVGLIDSSKSFFIFFGLCIIFACFLKALKYLCRMSAKCLKCVTSMLKAVFWGLFIRTLLEGFIETFLFSYLNLQTHQLGSRSEKISFIFASLFYFIYAALAFGMLRILANSDSVLLSPNSKIFERYGEFFKHFNFRSGFFVKHYNLWFLIRRFIFINCLIFFRNGVLQLLVSSLISLLQILFLKRLKPYKRKVDNYINILNEFCILTIYGLFAYTHLTDGTAISYEETIDIGLVAIVIVGVINLINIIVMLIFQIKAYRKWKRAERAKRDKAKTQSVILPRFNLRSLFARNRNLDNSIARSTDGLSSFQVEEGPIRQSHFYKERSQELDDLKLGLK